MLFNYVVWRDAPCNLFFFKCSLVKLRAKSVFWILNILLFQVSPTTCQAPIEGSCDSAIAIFVSFEQYRRLFVKFYFEVDLETRSTVR